MSPAPPPPFVRFINRAIAHLQAPMPRVQAAVQNLRAALVLRPGAAAAMRLSALISEKTGNWHQERRLLSRLLVLDPINGTDRLSSAVNGRRLNQMRSAFRDATDAALIRPDLATAYSVQITVLHRMGERVRWETAVRRARVAGPGDDAVWRDLGETVGKLLGGAAMIMLYRRAVILNPANGRNWTGLGVAEEQFGSVERAERLLPAMRMLAADPLLHIAVSARLARRRKRPEDVAAIVEPVFTWTGVSPSMLATLAFEEAGALDELGDVDAAFAMFQRANAFKAETAEARAARPAAFRERIELFSRGLEAVAGRGETGPAGQAPIFLVGFPRSGTTLLEQILDAHPKLAAIEELPLLNDLMTSLHRTDPRLLSGELPLGARLIRKLADEYLRRLRAVLPVEPGVRRIDKLPLNMVEASLIWRLFPDAQFILLLRHPADVCLSNFMQDYQPNDAMMNFDSVENVARAYDLVFGGWQRAVELLPLRVHRLCYEDLIEDREAAVRPLLDFLGVGWDPAVNDHVRHAQGRVIQTPSYRQVSQGLYTRARGRWRRYRSHLGEALDILQPWVERLGYAEPD